ncbi:Mariner Mos1 transposase [Eumeta japonica]|uniref:Mariner Mos1 transposase n=1 Tax=Eumeta variegata TaxID=151549 RepID=A0A4C1W545_EUMVA|nr:Mariner Mos1 transposase [Eumeta japonica]
MPTYQSYKSEVIEKYSQNFGTSFFSTSYLVSAYLWNQKNDNAERYVTKFIVRSFHCSEQKPTEHRLLGSSTSSRNKASRTRRLKQGFFRPLKFIVHRKERKTPKEILKTWYQFFRNLRLVYDGKMGLLFQQGRESCEDDPRPGRLHERQSYRSDGKLSRGVLFLQDNASVHTARVSRQALKNTGFSEIDHPPYSPDLAPSDYFLFSNLKKELRGRRFVDDNQMKMAVESHFEGIFFGRFEGVIHQM